MNRALLTKLHLVTAALVFPAVLMFLFTGALYTWGNKGAWYESTQIVQLDRPYASLSEQGLRQAALDALAAGDLPEPSGAFSVDGDANDRTASWVGARSEASVAAGPSASSAEVQLRQASVHRWLVQLHKAKGSVLFKIYATMLAVVLFLLVLSGMVMGLQVKALRRLTLISSAVGTVAFMGFVLLG